MVDPRQPDAQKVAALREALPATGAGIYLDTATRGPLPAETAAAMREADDWELRVGRATAGRDEDASQRADEARAVLAALVGAQPNEIALLPGVDLALSVAAIAPDWRRGDRILTTAPLDGGGAIATAVNGVAARFELEVDVVEPAGVRGRGQLLAALDAALTERTRMVMLSHVMPGTGLRLPLDGVAELARTTSAWLAIDASHAAGAVPVPVLETGADLVCFATDKWCLGPEGTAALWAGPRALAEARTVFATAASGPTPDASRFEPAAMPRSTLLGLARSVGWLEMYVGLEWALERTARLARHLHDALSAVPGVELLTGDQNIAGIVTFRVGRWSAAEVAEELGRRVFAIMPALGDLDALRASVAFFNTEDELERLAQAVSVIAAHTPATLPRRPSLSVMPDGAAQ